jgi:Tfp pilus assembly protein PilP
MGNQMNKELISEYFGDNNGKSAKIIATGSIFIVELLVDGKVIKKEQVGYLSMAETLADDFVRGDFTISLLQE